MQLSSYINEFEFDMDKQEYFYSDGDEILYYKYDIDDGLDAYFTRTYDKNRNLLTYNRYSK